MASVAWSLVSPSSEAPSAASMRSPGRIPAASAGVPGITIATCGNFPLLKIWTPMPPKFCSTRSAQSIAGRRIAADRIFFETLNMRNSSRFCESNNQNLFPKLHFGKSVEETNVFLPSSDAKDQTSRFESSATTTQSGDIPCR